MGEPLGVGIIGCGHIAGQYLRTLERLPDLAVVAVADKDPARARTLAGAHDGVTAMTVDDLLTADVDVVLNLTVPAAHAEVCHGVISAGKALYVEKPLAASTAEARAVMAAAHAAGVPVGCAPDTVLGTGIQTARQAVDDGLIGRPIGATATMVTPGHERWHPDPDFYYAPGGGPLLDMGPYYVTALVTLLGPVTRVIGAASATRTTRTIGSGPRAGQSVPVTTPTHVTGVLTHESGALSTIVTSFDAVATTGANIEVHGEAGTLVVPDPNHFTGDVRLCALAADGWQTLPVSGGYRQASRGYGLADMVWSATEQGGATAHAGSTAAARLVESRASGTLALHVLDVMESLLRSAAEGVAVDLASTAPRPPAVPLSEH